MQRRTALKLLGGGFASLALPRALRSAPTARDDFFIFVHAAGGWDVTLWADPRNERRGLVEPASSQNTDVAGIRHWTAATLDAGIQTFEPVVPHGSNMRLGPAIGDLFEHYDRLAIVNGLAMNTVSHDDGIAFSATGRHRAGGVSPESSIDVLLANELGVDQLMPDVSVSFPSYFVGSKLDRRAIPLRVATVETISKSLERSEAFLHSNDHDSIAAALIEETNALAVGSDASDSYLQLATQERALPQLLRHDFVEAFTARKLAGSYPQFKFNSREGRAAYGAAFALEAIRRNIVRCVSYGVGGLDTHNTNYREHAHTLQDLFDSLAALLKTLDETPHPTLQNTKLSERTHLLVFSDFCRTPQINLQGGRDHYPNNSALVISPKFRTSQIYGATDVEQLLPTPGKGLVAGSRPIAPPDVLATFLSAFGVDHRKYMRDGEVMRALLR